MVKHDYEDILPPGSISMPKDKGIKNEEYSSMARRIVNEWWYSQLQNKQHFYDVLKLIMQNNKRDNIDVIIKKLRNYLDGDAKAGRKTLKSDLSMDDRMMAQIETDMNKSILLATIYEALREMPLNFNKNLIHQPSVNRLWKPVYGNKDRLSNKITREVRSIRNIIYTARKHRGMLSWWYNNNIVPKFTIHRDDAGRQTYPLEGYGSINYFMNPPLGSIILFITDTSIRFNFIVSSTWENDDDPMVSHWAWRAITMNFTHHNEAKRLSITEWAKERLTVGYHGWFSSDPFWGSSDSGFIEQTGPFCIAFLNVNEYKALNQFINWPLHSPSI
jgi:hypothetical protein